MYWFICKGKQVSLPDVWSLVSSFVTRYVATQLPSESLSDTRLESFRYMLQPQYPAKRS